MKNLLITICMLSTTMMFHASEKEKKLSKCERLARTAEEFDKNAKAKNAEAKAKRESEAPILESIFDSVARQTKELKEKVTNLNNSVTSKNEPTLAPTTTVNRQPQPNTTSIPKNQSPLERYNDLQKELDALNKQQEECIRKRDALIRNWGPTKIGTIDDYTKLITATTNHMIAIQEEMEILKPKADDETRIAMILAIDSVLERGTKINDLVLRTDELAENNRRLQAERNRKAQIEQQRRNIRIASACTIVIGTLYWLTRR